jgi:hypothetical protein
MKVAASASQRRSRSVVTTLSLAVIVMRPFDAGTNSRTGCIRVSPRLKIGSPRSTSACSASSTRRGSSPAMTRIVGEFLCNSESWMMLVSSDMMPPAQLGAADRIDRAGNLSW